MIEKVDLRYRGTGDYPPAIKELLEKRGGNIGAVETYAGVSKGLFSKIRAGKEPFTPYVQEKIKKALEGNSMPPKRPALHATTLPETCPPLLADLISFTGSKLKTAKALGTSEGTLYAVIGGKPMPPVWITRAKAAMGRSVIGSTQEPIAPETPQIPEFVLWDGKSKGVLDVQPRGKAKGRKIRGVPQPIIDLVAKFEGNSAAASRAMGMAPTSLLNWFIDGFTFTELKQRRVHAAMHGVPLSGANSMGEHYDKYELGLAICMMKGANFERIAEIADILNAKIIFKKNTVKGWIIIYRMADEDLPKFKRLALRDAEEIVCP